MYKYIYTHIINYTFIYGIYKCTQLEGREREGNNDTYFLYKHKLHSCGHWPPLSSCQNDHRWLVEQQWSSLKWSPVVWWTIRGYKLYYLLYCLAHWELSPPISHNMDTYQSTSNLGWDRGSIWFSSSHPKWHFSRPSSRANLGAQQQNECCPSGASK